MAKIYQCITGNWLPNSKKIFKTYDECKEHIKKIEEMKESWISAYQVLSSIRVTMIDTEEFPEYKKIFKEYAEIRPLKKRRTSVSPKKGPGRPPNQKTEDKATKTQVD